MTHMRNAANNAVVNRMVCRQRNFLLRTCLCGALLVVGLLTQPAHAAGGEMADSIVPPQTMMPRYFYGLGANSTLYIDGISKTGQLRALGSVLVPGSGADSLVLNASGSFLYVANSNSNDVAMFSVDTRSGQLTSIGPNVPANPNPVAITIDPTDRFVYVANAVPGGGAVSSFVIESSNGTLNPTGMVPAGPNPTSLAVDPTGTYLFAVSQGSNSISVFTLNPSTGVPTPLQTLSAGTEPVALVIHPSAKFAYAINKGSNNISAFGLSQASGLWEPLGPSVATGTTPLSLALIPSGATLYVANSGSNNISVYSVNGSTGALTLSRKTVAGSAPSWVSVDPTGTYAFVGNSGSGNVEEFKIGATGGLTSRNTAQMGIISQAVANAGVTFISYAPISAYVTDYTNNGVQAFTVNTKNGALTAAGSEQPTDNDPAGVAVDYLGRFVYIANNFGGLPEGDVSGYTVSNTTWELTPTTPATFQAGMSPVQIVIDASGKFVYTANSASNTVSAYSIDTANGTLTPITPNVATGLQPLGIATDPWGRFLYTANNDGGGVSTFTINPTTGALTTVVSSPKTGSHPLGVAVTATAWGLFAYVTDEYTATLYCYSVDSMTGVLTFTTTVPIPSDPAGYPTTDPSGRFLYVPIVNAGISEYTIDSKTGAPTLQGTVSTGLEPVFMAVDISGEFAYVANAGENDVWVYKINQKTGVLTMSSKVPLPASGGTPRGITTFGFWF